MRILHLMILVLLVPLVLAVPPGTDDLPSDLDTSAFPNPNDSGGNSEEPIDESLRIETDDEEYQLQDTVEINGFGFIPEAENVEIEVLGESLFVEIDSNGRFEEEYTIPITVEKGEYAIVALNHEEPTQNPNSTITVWYPEPEIYTLPTQDNETPLVLGDDFLHNETVIVEFKSKDYEVQTEIDGSFELELPKQQEGNYSVYAEQKTNSEINATGKLEVFEEVPLITYYEDADADGYGSENSKDARTRPAGYVENNDDCNDGSASVFPGATEVCNGVDNDCDGTPDNGATCTDGNCESGVCVEETKEENPVKNPGNNQNDDQNEDQENNQPSTPPPAIEQPAEVEGGFNWMWLLIPLLLAILITGGVLGYVAYEGCLDLESFDGFTNGLKRAFGAESSSVASSNSGTSFSSPANPQLVNYIMKKRSEGYDDLTIRNALLKNNWPEPEIDNTFDSLYK